MIVLKVLLAILLTLLKVIGIALLVLLALIFLISWINVGALVRYSAEGPYVGVIAGPIRLQLIPKREKKPGKGKKKKKKKASKDKDAPEDADKKKKEKDPEEPRLTVGGMLPMFREFLGLLMDAQRTLRCRIRIRNLILNLTLGGKGSDPAKSAITYGRAWAALGNLMPKLMELFRIEKRDIDVEMDFLAEKPVIYMEADVVISIGAILRFGIHYGLRALGIYLRNTREHRKAKKAWKKAQKQKEKDLSRLEKQVRKTLKQNKAKKGGNINGTSSE